MTTDYIYLGSQLLAKTEDGETRWYMTDHQGSMIMLTDAEGKPVWNEGYTAFGEQTGETGYDLSESGRYTGKDYDSATGLYYYNARWYDPSLGRFITEDPAKDGSNWYVYVRNNPLVYIDPTGLENVYFIYTYDDSEKNQKMKKTERWSINDDIRFLEENGLTVRVIEAGTQADIENAIADKEAIVVVTSGHGYSTGGISTADGGSFYPSDLDSRSVGSNLETVIYENCYQGDYEQEWEAAFGNDVDVVGWEGTTDTIETINFNTFGILDRQDKNLRDYLEGAVVSQKSGEPDAITGAAQTAVPSQEEENQ